MTNVLLTMLMWVQAGPGRGKEWVGARRAMSGSAKGDHLRQCGLRKTLSFYAMFLDVTDPLDFKRLISVGNSCKMINVFCWSTFTHLVSSSWVKISEICSICKYISVVSMAVAAWVTLASHTVGFSVLSDRWAFLSPVSQKGKRGGWCFQETSVLVCLASQLRLRNSEFEPS